MRRALVASCGVSARIAGGLSGVGPPGRGLPRHGAWLVLAECPAGGLLRLVVASAEGGETAFAGPAAEVVWDRVIDVAAGGRPPAARVGASCLADLDDVPQGRAWLVSAGFPAVGAVPGLQRGYRHGRDPSRVPGWPGSGPGTGTRPGMARSRDQSRSGSWSRAGRAGGSGFRAAVGDGVPGGVGQGNAPLGGGVVGEHGGDGAGVARRRMSRTRGRGPEPLTSQATSSGERSGSPCPRRAGRPSPGAPALPGAPSRAPPG